MSLRKVPCCSGSYLFLLVEGIIQDNELGSFSPEITLLSWYQEAMGQISIVVFLFIPQWNVLLYLTWLSKLWQSLQGWPNQIKLLYFSCNYFCLVAIRKPERLDLFLSGRKAMFIEIFIHFKIIFSKEIFQGEAFKEKGKLMRTRPRIQLCYQCVLFAL